MTFSSRLGDAALAQVWAAEVELAVGNAHATRDAPGRRRRFGGMRARQRSAMVVVVNILVDMLQALSEERRSGRAIWPSLNKP
jgi:hypothetical protein